MFDSDNTGKITVWTLAGILAVYGSIAIWIQDKQTTAQENRIRHECRLKIAGARPPGWFSSGEDAWVCPDGATWYISTIKK